MATRQEILTAFNLITQTCMLNGHTTGLATIMDYKDSYQIIEQPTKLNFESFNHHKIEVESLRVYMDSLSDKIDTVLTLVDSTFLDNGISFVSSKMIASPTRQMLNSDNQVIKTLITNAASGVSLASNQESLNNLSQPFKSFIGNCIFYNYVKAARQTLDPQIVNANRVHNDIDIMSYLLQGVNPTTGEQHGLSVDDIKIKIEKRIKGSCHFIRYVDDGADKSQMLDVLNYVDANLPTAKNFQKLDEIGNYIDSQITKLILIRRWWAL